MGTGHASADGDLVLVKGAPEELLGRADRCLDDGVEQSLTAELRQELTWASTIA